MNKPKRPPTEKQLAAAALYEKRIKVLEKFLKKIPEGAVLKRELATLKTLENRGHSLDFLLSEVSLGYRCNFMTHLFSEKGREVLAAAKLKSQLKFSEPERIMLQSEKVGEDAEVEKKPDLREFLRA